MVLAFITDDGHAFHPGCEQCVMNIICVTHASHIKRLNWLSLQVYQDVCRAAY